MKIAIVAGEASGDMLGASLLKALKEQFPDLQAEGIAGPLMQAEGCRSLFEMERLSVMGFIEPLSRLPELFNMRKKLIKRFINHPPDVFIGIDAPAFNIGLAYHLKKAGIKTVHYVSPSVWAWRQKRILKIKKSVDLMLTLLPFENAIYDAHHIENCFVGHPLADEIPLEVDAFKARHTLGLPADKQIIAILPGSRGSELKQLTHPFIETAKRCYAKNSDLIFVTPMISAEKQVRFQAAVDHLAPECPFSVIKGQSQTVMAAADVVLLASGTATLEAMLLGKPMVMAYKLNPLTHWLAKRLVKTDTFALPNLLLNEKVVPEFIQDAATPEALSQAVMAYIENPAATLKLQKRFMETHKILQRQASQKAARAIVTFFKNQSLFKV